MRSVRINVLVICFFTFSSLLFAQPGNYSRVKVHADLLQTIAISRAGVPVDHLMERGKGYFVGEFSSEEIRKMKVLGAQVDYLIEDLEYHYAHQNDGMSPQKVSGVAGTPANFHLGSMGGYLTFDEIVAELDSMASKYPSLITIRDSIGTSVEGRTIWLVKISDNPSVDETEPEVLYDALHHSREPNSVMQMMYYMWHLLENYGTDDEATYLIDNREMYFVPVVNPDGYVYNQTTNPSGGGMWRKNRRNNGGGNYGVDLNRNYGLEWAYDNFGSSPDPSSDTYRGTAAFSEPETQTMKNLCESREFKLAFNYHTYGNLLIRPWGYDESVVCPDADLYNDYGELLTEKNGYVFGSGTETVGYTVNGDSDDWMYGEQVTKNKIMSMTPEAGEGADGFWPAMSKIIPFCEDNLEANLRLAWLAGDYIVVDSKLDDPVSTLSLWLPADFTNLGLVTSAAVSAEYKSTDPNIASIGSGVILGTILPEGVKTDSFAITLNAGIPEGTWIHGVIETTYGGGYVRTDSVSFLYGNPTLIFFEDGESGGGKWTGGWDITNEKAYSGTNSITDSPFSEYNSNENNKFTTVSSIDLTAYTSPYMTFWTTYDIENGWDYVQVLISTNGTSFTAVEGEYTDPGGGSFQPSGEPVYDGAESDWVQEYIDLSAYEGENIWIRFQLRSDNFVQEDGYYFDDLSVWGFSPANSRDEELATDDLYLYPNPSTGTVMLNMPDGMAGDDVEVVFSDLQGKILLTHKAGKGKSISLHSLAKGIYLYQVQVNGNRGATRKIVVY